MGKLLALIGIVNLIFVVACSSFTAAPQDELSSLERAVVEQEVESLERSGDRRDSFNAAAPAAAPAMKEVIREVEEEAIVSGNGALETAQRKVISTASISIEVEVVQTATADVRAIAESLGGFVEQLSSPGGAEQQRATMTIRVPQAQFFTALEHIEALGKVLSKNMGSEDVSERFIDLEARLKSSLREEQSLLSLLERTATVSEVLTVERELTRVRSEIERFQGQLNFLERRVDLGTITVSLVPPNLSGPEPPSATLSVEVTDVTGDVAEVKALVASLNGVVEQVLLSVRNDRERANLTIRVFSADFQRTLDFLEDQGKVRSKELREGSPGDKAGTATEEKPKALIAVSLVEKTRSVNVGLIVGIVVGVGLAVLLALAFYWSYRFGVRRQRRLS